MLLDGSVIFLPASRAFQFKNIRGPCHHRKSLAQAFLAIRWSALRQKRISSHPRQSTLEAVQHSSVTRLIVQVESFPSAPVPRLPCENGARTNNGRLLETDCASIPFVQDSSSHLNLWKKRLGRVPDYIWEHTKLETLVLAENDLSEVSEQIGRLKSLRTRRAVHLPLSLS